jgi:RNA polymerase sigma factor (sigma-70 family)
VDERELLERFIVHVDEAAFEALVIRYGPMVFKICRGVLRDQHDAEDAFQATFLLLVRKAPSIRDRRLLAPWLSQIAYRASLLASRRAARRRQIEQIQSAAEDSAIVPEADDHELIAALHQELDRLPERYRSPVVLCYLQGLSHDEAARTLQWPIGTVKGRLVRARRLLRERLSRRGAVLEMAWHCARFEAASQVQLPSGLVTSACRTARIAALGRSPATTVSVSVLALMKGVSRIMIFRSLRTATIGVSLVALLAATAVFGRQGSADPQDGTGALLRAYDANRAAKAKPRDSDDNNSTLLRAHAGLAQTGMVRRLSPELANVVEGVIVKSIPISKDCMVLSYIPDWSHGLINNIAVANNGGGVRTLVAWPELSAEDVEPRDRQFLLAMYSAKTTVSGPTGPLMGFEITQDWPENTSWKTMPAYAEDPAVSFEFAPGNGWKLMDITGLVRAQTAAGRKQHGLILRFLNEDHEKNWSGYGWVSREAAAVGQGIASPQDAAMNRPILLVVDPAN